MALVVDVFRLDEVFASTSPSQRAPDSLEAELIPDHEEFVALNSTGIPDGSVLRFMHNYGPWLASVQKRQGKWLVDLRWWHALTDLIRERKEFSRLAHSKNEGERRQAEALWLTREREPPYVARSFLCALLIQETEWLRRLLPEGTNLDSLYPVGFQQDQYTREFSVMACEMPVVEVQGEEPLLSPTGEFARVQDVAKESRVLIGEFGSQGTTELVFFLEQQDDSWRVRPRDYLAQLDFGP
jgi:hypothetical protein